MVDPLFMFDPCSCYAVPPRGEISPDLTQLVEARTLLHGRLERVHAYTYTTLAEDRFMFELNNYLALLRATSPDLEVGWHYSIPGRTRSEHAHVKVSSANMHAAYMQHASEHADREVVVTQVSVAPFAMRTLFWMATTTTLAPTRARALDT